MFSIADMAVAGAVALLLFGPEQLPKVARRAGGLIRDVQNTSQAFIREMERAAEDPPAPELPPLGAAPEYHETPVPAPAAPEPAMHEPVAHEPAAHTPAPTPAAVQAEHPESHPG